MSEPVSNARVEDVLSSIRRLVSEEKRPISREESASADSGKEPSPLRLEDVVEEAQDDKLLLTSSLRISEADGEDPVALAPFASAENAPSTDNIMLPSELEAEELDSDENAVVSIAQTDIVDAVEQLEDPSDDWPESVTSAYVDLEEEGEWPIPSDHVSSTPAKIDTPSSLAAEFAEPRPPVFQRSASFDDLPDRAESEQKVEQTEFSPRSQDLESTAVDQPDEASPELGFLEVSAPKLVHSEGERVSEQDLAETLELNTDPNRATNMRAALENLELSAPLNEKIAALETLIGERPDQWEPDGLNADPYSGTEDRAMHWDEAPIEAAKQHAPAEVEALDVETPVAEPDLTSVASIAPLDDPLREAPDAAEDAEDLSDLDVGGLTALDEEVLRDMVSEIVRQELQGALGERITRNVRKLVRREIHRALATQELD